MENLKHLFETCFKMPVESISLLSAAGSNRQYYRLQSADISVIGVIGTSKEENTAFVSIARDFYAKHLPMPQVFAVSDDKMHYLQEDLGNVSLFDFIENGRNSGVFSRKEKKMLQKTISLLPKIQILGAENFDFSVCYPQENFDLRSVFWDLNYFKYNFLKLQNIDFQENKLENDFEKLADILCRDTVHHISTNGTFLYRDFQTRNVMIRNNEAYFIDFQGGRRGNLYYDVASFLWQAKANFPSELKNELLETYLSELKNFVSIDNEAFKTQLNYFVLFRILQTLGAYGFRGLIEKKPHFIQSIPPAIENLRAILQKIPNDKLPYLTEILTKIITVGTENLPPTTTQMVKQRAKNMTKRAEDFPSLQVSVFSFSYKKGIPEDLSGNGGGFVFDCRSIHNPGKYAEYQHLTGKDKPVIDFLEQDGEILLFLENAFALVDKSVQRYLERGFSHLQICFGCTGGQHRSVYAAQKTAEHVSAKFDVKVALIHREQN